MTTMVELESIEQWHDLLESSSDKKVFLLKHSTTCPISAEAYKQYDAFINDYAGSDATFALVKVIEQRPVSNTIAEELSIKHESPQFFIFENKEPKWVDSHWNITKKKIEAALS